MDSKLDPNWKPINPKVAKALATVLRERGAMDGDESALVAAAALDAKGAITLAQSTNREPIKPPRSQNSLRE